MRLVLGGRSYDLATRALVIGRAPTVEIASRLVDDGADVVEFTDADLVVEAEAAGLTVPLAIAAVRIDDVTPAYQAGAVLGSCADPAFLAASAGAGAVVVTSDPAAALVAGVASDRIVADQPGTTFPTVVTTDDVGEMAVAVTAGARLIRTSDVKAARRVADVLAAILEAGP